MSHYETYNRLLNDATNIGHAEIVFWRSVIEAHHADRLSVEDIGNLIGSTSITRPVRTSRATTYRLIEKWTALLADLDNPGRGA